MSSTPKLGRWTYCKYCHRDVLPAIGDGIVVCTRCNAGLAPLDQVQEFGSLSAWRDEHVHKHGDACGTEKMWPTPVHGWVLQYACGIEGR